MVINKRIIAELIGLARTTDGNEHLINASATTVILECLKDCMQDDDSIFLHKIDSVKRQMVPNCYMCASPCGKNNAYDIDKIQEETAAVLELKQSILDLLIRFAETGQTVNNEEEALLYRSLILLGIDGPSEDILRSYQAKLLDLL